MINESKTQEQTNPVVPANLIGEVARLTNIIEHEQLKRTPDFSLIQSASTEALAVIDKVIGHTLSGPKEDKGLFKELFYAYLSKTYMHNLQHDYEQVRASQHMMKHYAEEDIDLLMDLDAQSQFIKGKLSEFNVQH